MRNIKVCGEHSVDIFNLPDYCKVLDIGCRGFQFRDHIKMHVPTAEVFCVDIDNLNVGFDQYQRCAISDFDGICGLTKTDDPQATRINKAGTGTDAYTLESYSKNVEVEFWDLIKIDIEGGEYEIIMSLEKPPCQQLSVEFHLHTGIYKVFEMNAMENKLKAFGYEFVKHDYTTEHGAGFNYWDSLFILK